MDIDITALKALEREREIPFDVLVDAIEAALLGAYHRTEGAYKHARVELDRRHGHHHGDGVGLYPGLQILRGRHRQPERLAGS